MIPNTNGNVKMYSQFNDGRHVDDGDDDGNDDEDINSTHEKSGVAWKNIRERMQKQQRQSAYNA